MTQYIAPPPLWLPQIGGTVPSLFADFTTEGGNDYYWYNGAQYAGYAAWLFALSGTFSRSSAAYYTNASGLLASAGNNVLRFDYNPSTLVSNGVLLEGTSTNHSLNSGNALSWTTLDGATRAGGVSDPTGGTAGVTITSAAGTGLHDIRVGSIGSQTSGNTVTHSFFVARGTAPYVYVGDYAQANFPGITLRWSDLSISTNGIQSATGAVSPTAWAGWYRLSITFVLDTASSSPVVGPAVASAASIGNNSNAYTAAGTETVNVWGAQGAETLPFASSYIQTTSSTASRSADGLYVPWTAATFAALLKSINQGTITNARLLDTGTNGLLYQTAGPDVTTNNGSQTLAAGVNAWGSANKLVVGGSPGGRVLSANGNVAQTDANALVASAGTNMYLGASSDGSKPSYGDVETFGLWSIAPTAGQAATLSTLP